MQNNFECARYADFPQPFPSFAAGANPKLSREDINALPLFHYSGKITLVRSANDMAYALSRLRSGNGGETGSGRPGDTGHRHILGFDTETRPSFRKGTSYSPSLLQLALEDEVFLFHFKWQPFDERLISILEDPHCIKTGVAVHDDMVFLSKIAPFKAASVVDLGEVARQNDVENRGLRGLAALFLGLRISKGEQCSNWGNSALTPRQIRYAATDAWVSRAVYFRMLASGLVLGPAREQKPLPAGKKPAMYSKRAVVKKQARQLA